MTVDGRNRQDDTLIGRGMHSKAAQLVTLTMESDPWKLCPRLLLAALDTFLNPERSSIQLAGPECNSSVSGLGGTANAEISWKERWHTGIHV